MNFDSIPDAIEAIRSGKMVIVVDDEDRENEGDLTIAAGMITPESVDVCRPIHGVSIRSVAYKDVDCVNSMQYHHLVVAIRRRGS